MFAFSGLLSSYDSVRARRRQDRGHGRTGAQVHGCTGQIVMTARNCAEDL